MHAKFQSSKTQTEVEGWVQKVGSASRKEEALLGLLKVILANLAFGIKQAYQMRDCLMRMRTYVRTYVFGGGVMRLVLS